MTTETDNTETENAEENTADTTLTVEEVMAKVTALESALAEKTTLLNKTAEEAKKQRQQKATEKAEKEEALLANGKFEELAKSLKETVSSLQSEKIELAKKAELFDRDSQAREVALAQRIAALPEADQNLVKAGATLTAQEQLAARFLGLPAGKTTSQVNEGVQGGGKPPDAPAVDVNNPAALLALHQKDPEGYRRVMDSSSAGETQKVSTFNMLFGRKSTKK